MYGFLFIVSILGIFLNNFEVNNIKEGDICKLQYLEHGGKYETTVHWYSSCGHMQWNTSS